MIKFISKIFKTKEDYAKSTLTVELDITKKTEGELFDDAVDKVIRDKTIEIIKEQLAKLCYSQEEWDQTKAAEEDPKANAKHRRSYIQKYPKASVYECDASYFRTLYFDLDKFIDRIIDTGVSDD